MNTKHFWSKNKRKLALLTVLTTVALLTGCRPYDVHPEDASVSAMLQRWAQAQNKELHWELEEDWPLEDSSRKALGDKLSGTRDIRHAIEVVVQEVARSERRRSAQRGHEPLESSGRAHLGYAPGRLTACLYPNAVRVYRHRSLAAPCDEGNLLRSGSPARSPLSSNSLGSTLFFSEGLP